MQRLTEGTPRPRGLVLCAMAAVTLAACSKDPRHNATSAISAAGIHSPAYEERPTQSKALFARLDQEGRRLSLVLNRTGLTFNHAGDISYGAEWTAGEKSPLEKLLAGEEIAVSAMSGHEFGEHETDAILRLQQSSNTGRSNSGELTADRLPIELVSTSGKVQLSADLKEEPAGHEITIVSYNVENFFDQVDEDRNSAYGDYRLQKNDSGQSSNYGEAVRYDGRMMTYTDAKAQNIRKALLAVAPEGPEIAGLVEVESRKALNTLLQATKDLGYQYAQFSDWSAGSDMPAIGMGLLSKFPISEWSLLTPTFSKKSSIDVDALVGRKPSSKRNAAPRPILKVKVNVYGHDLLVYVNHWKSKAGPESMRKAYAEVLEKDLEKVLSVNPRADYVLLGDFNSEYNEAVILTDEHNDTNGTTGINHVLKSQGDELATANLQSPYLKYDLHYELDPEKRVTAWHPGFNWSSLDHIIIGAGLYDHKGLTYVDGSFDIPRPQMPRLDMLFTQDGRTKRWFARRKGPVTTHSIGGFSDHLPIFARFRIAQEQSDALIPLHKAGMPDDTDMPVEFSGRATSQK
jgi:endonuclease/exonuclease/phosphatase family metal-dependent hydrolase